MAKKKNTLQDLDAFLKAQSPEETANEQEAAFLEKDPVRLVQVEEVVAPEETGAIYKGKQPSPDLTNEEAIYSAIVQLATTRKSAPEQILKRLIEMREEELMVEPHEPSWADWISQTSATLWKEYFG